MSTNLRNKSYCFENKQLTKDEYEKRMRELDLGNFKVLQDLYQKFWDDIMLKTPRRHLMILNSVDSSGDFMHNCKNVRHSFRVSESEDSAYSVDASNLKDCYDAYEPAFDCVQQYDCHACNRLSYSKFCSISYDNHHLEYCKMCHGSSELFGCIGLRNKQYCILNKQYTKEEYQALVVKIKEQMQTMLFVDSAGRSYQYGEYFPIQLSPFAYNETVAQEYYPLTQEKADSLGFVWHERGARDHKITKPVTDLPVNIKDAPDAITKEVIGCAHQGLCQEQCTTAFKIIAQELEFYRGLGLPLPRLCPNCRHYERLHRRNPMRLWHRQCMCEVVPHPSHAQGRCANEFETTYAPERPEIVYCESCYQAEVM